MERQQPELRAEPEGLEMQPLRPEPVEAEAEQSAVRLLRPIAPKRPALYLPLDSQPDIEERPAPDVQLLSQEPAQTREE